MTISTARMFVYESGCIGFDGTEYEPRELVVIEQCRVFGRICTALVLRVSGHTYWGGVGQPRAYAPASYETWLYDGDQNSPKLRQLLAQVAGKRTDRVLIDVIGIATVPVRAFPLRDSGPFVHRFNQEG